MGCCDSRQVDAGASEGVWRAVPQAAVGTLVIVVGLPDLEYGLALGERGKPMTRETLTSEAPIERLADGVVDQLPGSSAKR